MNIIPCIKWVKRGVAKSIPDKVKLSEDELRRVIEDTKDKIDLLDDEDDEQGEEDEEKMSEDDKSSTAEKGDKRKLEDDDDDIETKYDLADYDEDDEAVDMLKGIGNLTYYASNSEDPYVTLKEEGDSDDEDFEIKATDNLIVVGKTEKEYCCLEVYVYNEDLGNLYVHHDIILSSFPLAVEWLNYDVGEDKPGNFVAVGTMEPIIEIWDLDLVDSLEPVVVLGSKVKSKSKKKKTDGHTDAVLALAWNANVRNVLGSASADSTVKLWDLSEGKPATTISQHEDKVQCLAWCPSDSSCLLSGSFDNTVKMFDCRDPNKNFKSWSLNGEVENILWDKFNQTNFYATTDKGHVFYMDKRSAKPVFTLSAHSEAVTGLCQSSSVPGLLVTTSTDKTMKIWDVQDNKPSTVLERNLKLNQLFCVDACPEAPFVFAVGGEKEIKVWDIRESATVRKHFASRAPVGVTMEGDGDVKEEMEDAMSGMMIDKEEEEDVQTLLGEGTTDVLAVKKKKKKKKRKKQSQN
ncbi:periodic tryptophan protein 1 homolog [Saccostrea echinata]|uniref:periodic tryptophan protein 1 homolog n=1 Tax=Saccostrea echinata TaxID=191078 RepID=UPI002A7F300E|nr:periodic tryptophan protein 1 homolog [Saccostrea echinata]